MSATTTSTTTTTTRKGPKIDFSPINPNNLGTLRKLNQVLFPIKYSEKFYKDVLLSAHEPFCQLIYYNDIPVGTICCRIETDPTDSSKARLYIMTMGILAGPGRTWWPVAPWGHLLDHLPYRSRKAGTKALQQIINAAISSNESPSPSKKPLKSLYMHVQTSNDDARRFYERNGFKEVGRVDGYYKKIEPHDAWVLERFLDV